MFLILFDSLTKQNYYSFYSAWKSLHQSLEGYTKSFTVLFYQVKSEIITRSVFYLFFDKQLIKLKVIKVVYRIQILFSNKDSVECESESFIR